jgi:hypothetical protein
MVSGVRQEEQMAKRKLIAIVVFIPVMLVAFKAYYRAARLEHFPPFCREPVARLCPDMEASCIRSRLPGCVEYLR